MLALIELLFRRFRVIKDEELKESPSYGIWFVGTTISASLIFWQVFSILNEAVDTIYKQPNILLNSYKFNWTPFLSSLKTFTIFLGIGILWFILWYVISYLCTIMILKKRNDIEEMAANNLTYFLVRTSLHITFTISFITLLQPLLRLFLPVIPIPFYH